MTSRRASFNERDARALSREVNRSRSPSVDSQSNKPVKKQKGVASKNERDYYDEQFNILYERIVTDKENPKEVLVDAVFKGISNFKTENIDELDAYIEYGKEKRLLSDADNDILKQIDIFCKTPGGLGDHPGRSRGPLGAPRGTPRAPKPL